MLTYLVVALALAQRAWSNSDCASAPHVSLPVQDVVLSNGQSMRGIPIGAGTPRQDFSMLPLPFFNDTWIYNTSADAILCNWSTPAGCLTYRGGLYNGDSSSTSSGAIDVYAAGGDPRDTIPLIKQDSPYSAWVNDVLRVGATSLEDYPIGMPGSSLYPAYDNQANLGLGPNSTILNALVAAGKIASRSFSWWWGLTGATPGAQMDGQIVFGGYDAAKISGTNYTMPLAPPRQECHSSMSVTISDISLGFPNGTTTSITSPNIIIACILPHYPLIVTLPQVPFYDSFEIHTGTKNVGRGGGTGIDFGGMLYWPDAVYQGDLIVTLDNGFQATFPNELLVVPPSDVRSSGALYANTTVREVLISPTTGGNNQDWAILGRHFFQTAYLTVDYDARTFTLAQANATTDTNIVAIGQNCSTPAVNVPTGSSKNNTKNTGADTNSTHKSLPVGVLVGSVVGSVLGALAIIGVGVFCFMRRRKARAAYAKQESAMSLAPQDTNHPYSQPVAFVPPYPQEMWTHPDPREMIVEERPLELSNDRAAALRQKRLLQGPNSPVELG